MESSTSQHSVHGGTLLNPAVLWVVHPPALPGGMQLPVGGGLDPGGAAAAMQRYMSEVTLSAGQLLWRVDDLADEMYIIEKGAVRVRPSAAEPAGGNAGAAAAARRPATGLPVCKA
jgi:hypothetical protein